MYLPRHFEESRPEVLHAAIRQSGLATLVTLGVEGLVASHIPMLLRAEPAPWGTLLGHVSRANPQWRDLASGVEALAIFLGPDAYVTPSWYPTKRKSGKVVPTWNYVAIHAYGQLRPFEDPGRLLELVTALTDRQETPRAEPWRVADAPDDFIQTQLKAIVGLELTITRLEGKWKMSQNRPTEDATGVVSGLAAEGHPDVAAIVAERNGLERPPE
ncbi:MAG TPA: FMN-binding negative transcriptional regulator [Chloroflexota bacterium]|nr:FMN-binding negative transcriptional regulator [Chloroflexota bacterium]